MKRRLYVIAGPTASGKTAVSIELAKKIGGEIISADSMQIYKYMDIGSAKVTKEEMQQIPHHLVDELMPNEGFSVNRFQSMAHLTLEKIYSHGHIPIIAGGTGFYIQSVTRNIDFSTTDNEHRIRESVVDFYEKNGTDALHNWLFSLDEASAESIHKNNTKRVQRAIEYYLLTGERMSEHNAKQQTNECPYNLTFVVLTMERDLLYHRINKRVDTMIEKGLVQEVEYLKSLGYTSTMTAMQGLGYKEILHYLEGEISLEDAIYQIKRDTRHFAKRQLTWFRREADVHWIHVDHHNFNEKQIVQEILKLG